MHLIKNRIRRPCVAFAASHVVDGNTGERIIIGDCAHPLSVCNRGVEGVTEIDEESLIGLSESVTVDQDSDCLCSLSRIKDERAAVGHIVTSSGRSAVGCAEVDGYDVTARRRKRNGKHGICRPGISLRHSHIVDRKR